MPLQSITLEQLEGAGVDLGGLSLESIDLSNTALRSIALRSIALRSIALRSIPIDGYRPSTIHTPRPGARFWATSVPTQRPKLTVGDSDLLTMQLGGVDVDAVPVFDIPLSGLANVASTGLEPIALRSIALRSIYLENTALRSIALRSIALRSIDFDYIGSIIDCGVAKYAQILLA